MRHLTSKVSFLPFLLLPFHISLIYLLILFFGFLPIKNSYFIAAETKTFPSPSHCPSLKKSQLSFFDMKILSIVQLVHTQVS